MCEIHWIAVRFVKEKALVNGPLTADNVRLYTAGGRGETNQTCVCCDEIYPQFELVGTYIT